MKTIEIDEVVYTQLAARVTDFGQTPNDVLRRLLLVDEPPVLNQPIPAPITEEWLNGLRRRVITEDPTVTPEELHAAREHTRRAEGDTTRSPVIDFTRSREFQVHREAESRYLSILSWLFGRHKDEFSKIESYGRGKRAYFARSRKKIEADAPYAQIKQIPGTPYFAMTTLDNRAKRKVLTYVLTTLGYPRDAIEAVIQTIPSSSRGNDPLDSF